MKNNNLLESEFQKIVETAQFDKKKLKDKKVLVTGANGFLGQYIVGAISTANRKMKINCKVNAIGMSKPREVLASILKQDKNISYKQVDLTKKFKLSGYDFIFHAAGYGQPSKFIHDPFSTIAINVFATNQLLTDSPNSTFVFFSSSEIYGDVSKEHIPVKEGYNGNCPIHSPRSVYAESKRLGEALCVSYARDKKSKIKIVRISPTYGPGLPHEDRRVMTDFIGTAISGKPIEMLDDGSSIKSFGYVSDTVSMILYVAFNSKDTVYNVGSKNSISIKNLAKKIATYCDVGYVIPKKSTKMASLSIKPVKQRRLQLKKILPQFQ